MGNSSSSSGGTGINFHHHHHPGGSSGGGGGSSSGNGGERSHNRPTVHLPISSLPSPFRSGTGSLGLSRAELDARCQPSGLYPSCEWEPKTIRRLIGDGKIAARLKGSDSRCTKTDRECPICFMYYSENNITKCCQATICTECYLQIRPQKDKHTTCPFCNCPKLSVAVAKGMDEDAVAKREEEEQRVIEATIRNRAFQVHGESAGQGGAELIRRDETGSLSDCGASSHSGFGSSLDNYNRTRTFSNASNVSGSSDRGYNDTPTGTPRRSSNVEQNDANALLSFAMSPEDRQELEREMRAQLSHPTHRRIQDEAEEARMRHVQEWYSSDSGIRHRMREARMAELTRLLQRTHRDNETASGRSTSGGRTMGFLGLGGNSSRARDIGRLINALETSGGRGSAGRGLDDLMEAAFFLGMEEDFRRHSIRRTSVTSRSDEEDGDTDIRRRGSTRDEDREADIGYVGLRPRHRLGPRGNHRRGSRGANRGVSTAHLDTAELLMRGISEEEQLAMAIALSMRDASQGSNEQSGGAGGEQPGGASGEQSSNRGSQHAQRGDDDDSSSDSSFDSSSDSESDTNDVRSGEQAAPWDENEEEVVFIREGQETEGEQSRNTRRNTSDSRG